MINRRSFFQRLSAVFAGVLALPQLAKSARQPEPKQPEIVESPNDEWFDEVPRMEWRMEFVDCRLLSVEVSTYHTECPHLDGIEVQKNIPQEVIQALPQWGRWESMKLSEELEVTHIWFKKTITWRVEWPLYDLRSAR